MSEENLPMFCPNCGAMLDGKRICEQCGHDALAKPEPSSGPATQETTKPQQDIEASVGYQPSSGGSGSQDKIQSRSQPKAAKKRKKKKKQQKSKKTSKKKKITSGEIPLAQYLKEYGEYLWIANILFAFIPWIDAMVVYFGLSTALRSLGGTGAIFIDWLLWTSFGVIFAIAISFVVVKPIGEKMKQEKWEEIVTDYSKFGKYQIPQILFWAIMEMIIISVWGGLLLLVVALLICVFSKYKGQIEWTKE